MSKKEIYQLVLKNGMIVDPVEGQYLANIGINNGQISKISNSDIIGRETLDATGKKISPGFIDIHMHEDKLNNGKIEFEVFNYMVKMGVTTVVGGNCGLGECNIAEYLNCLQKNGSPVNYLGLIGHNSLREEVACLDNYQQATAKQIDRMKEILRDCLDKGGSGLSFGLEYIPGTSLDELLSLCRVVKESGKIVAVHYRFDGRRSLEALAEMIIVAKETGVRFQVSHLGSCIAFGQMEAGLAMLEAANQAGIDIMADVYPYDSFCTYIGSAVFDKGCFKNWDVGYNAIEMAEGKYGGQRCTEEIFNYVRENEADKLAIAFVMNEEEVVKAMKHPLVMIASDALINKGKGHPRSAGTFPRVLGKYVRETGELGFISAINKMTMMPAERLGLSSKGRIKEGYDADLIVFDFNSIAEQATFKNPALAPAGIKSVILGGSKVVDNGVLTGEKPGYPIRN